VAIGDLDADGKDDIVFRKNNELWHVPLNGLQSGPGKKLRVSQNISVSTPDLNGDGYSDILSTSSGIAYYFPMKYNETGTMTTISLQGGDLALTGDFNGDGTDDILTINHSTGTYTIYPVEGQGSTVHVDVLEGYSEIVTIPGENFWIPVMAKDFNADGRDDIFWHNYETGENYIYLMQEGLAYIGKHINYVSDLDWKPVPDNRWDYFFDWQFNIVN
jgi:hypothetical protein